MQRKYTKIHGSFYTADAARCKNGAFDLSDSLWQILLFVRIGREVLVTFELVAFVAEQTALVGAPVVIIHIFEWNIAPELWTVAFRQIFEVVHKKTPLSTVFLFIIAHFS